MNDKVIEVLRERNIHRLKSIFGTKHDHDAYLEMWARYTELEAVLDIIATTTRQYDV